jgi:hypothetical protein
LSWVAKLSHRGASGNHKYAHSNQQFGTEHDESPTVELLSCRAV